MKDIKRTLIIVAITVLLFQTSPAQSSDAALIARAKAIHEHVLKLDTHNDIEPSNFTPDCNYTMRLTTQVNIPKMVQGGMDVFFMIVYVGQGPLTPEGYDNAYRQAIAKFDAIHRLTEKLSVERLPRSGGTPWSHSRRGTGLARTSCGFDGTSLRLALFCSARQRR